MMGNAALFGHQEGLQLYKSQEIATTRHCSPGPLKALHIHLQWSRTGRKQGRGGWAAQQTLGVELLSHVVRVGAALSRYCRSFKVLHQFTLYDATYIGYKNFYYILHTILISRLPLSVFLILAIMVDVSQCHIMV